jgi:hypothetical protein
VCAFSFFPPFFFVSCRLCDSLRGSGMKRNWLSLSKAFLRDLQRPVYTLVSVLSLCPSFACFPSFIGFTQPRLFSPREADELRSNGHRCPPLPSVTFALERFSHWPFHVRLRSNPLITGETNMSMPHRGGKVAMAVALSTELPADGIEHLIVADIAPSNAALSTEFQAYVEAMNKIEQSKVSSRREAQDILASYEPVSRHRQQTPSVSGI